MAPDRHRVNREEWLMKKLIVLAVVFAMAAAACGDVADGGGTTITTVESDASEQVSGGDTAPSSDDQATESDTDDSASSEPPTTTIPEGRAAEEDELPERVPPTDDTPVTGEADPSLVASIKQDLIGRTGAAESDINVVRSEEVIWNDGSLGCPVPGEMYTQALVNGFWVVLEHGGTEYDYRANDRGFFRLCEGGAQPPSNPTG